jgi:shikimate dehydrogenase
MHEAALKFFGLAGSYNLLDVPPEQLAQTLPRLIDDGYCGFNVTIPHKEAMFQLADRHTPEAATAGAANTIKVGDGGTLTAHNTDIAGFERALMAAILSNAAFNKPQPTVGKGVGTACVVGAGGAARAALITLPRLGFKRIIVVARDAQKARQALSQTELADKLEVRSIPCEPISGDNIDLVVQTTPIGQCTNEIPGWFEHIVVQETSRSMKPLFFDMVYARDREETPLVRFARQRGWSAIDGTNMLVNQACLAFEFWTGRLPPFNLMKEALNRARESNSIR